VAYGCEKYRNYHEHKEFFLHTDNQDLACLLRHVNHPLGLKWYLYELELQKHSKGINEFWETVLSN
jgi:hypothetical protein